MAGAALTLIGFAHSVYSRSVAIALAEKGLEAAWREVDPFDPQQAEGLRALHPFGRVPVLIDGDFTLYESGAILRYVETLVPAPALFPAEPRAAARAAQVISTADAHVYGPLVRGAFSHGVYRPLMGEPVDAGKRDAGLAQAPAVLDALETVAREGLALRPGAAGAAEGHLFAMLDYFAMLEPGAQMLRLRAALWCWFEAFAQRPAAAATRPKLT